MRVGELVSHAAHLHLWTTNAFLFESKALLEAWGFEYKSVLVWVKPEIGLGNYWRLAHEFLVLGVRGGARCGVHLIFSKNFLTAAALSALSCRTC